jgi:hypothetical protein
MIGPISKCTVSDAISSLGIENFVVYGNPKNEEEFLTMFRKVVGVDSTNSAILSSDPNDFDVTWSQVAAKITELEAAEPMRLLREERDRKLAATDWRATVDYPGNDKQLWLDYRQALRDVTEQDPNNVTWPEEPV